VPIDEMSAKTLARAGPIRGARPQEIMNGGLPCSVRWAGACS